ARRRPKPSGAFRTTRACGGRARSWSGGRAGDARRGSLCAGAALRSRRMLRVRYTAWDGTQEIRLEAERVFEKLAEHLSFTDDVQQALDWLLHQGLEWEQGVRVMGLDDFLEQLREAMRSRYREVNLREAFRELREKLEDLRDLEDFQRRYGDLFQGPQSLSYREAVELMREMERLKRLEESLLSGNLEAVDLENLGALLGPEAARNFQLLQEVMVLLVDAGYVTQREGRAHLSPKRVRKIGQLALRDHYQGLLRHRPGGHQTDHRGSIELRPEETKRYQHGD